MQDKHIEVLRLLCKALLRWTIGQIPDYDIVECVRSAERTLQDAKPEHYYHAGFDKELR